MFLTAQLSLLPEKKKKRKVNNITIHVYHLSATYSSIIEMPKVTVQPFQISDPSS